MLFYIGLAVAFAIGLFIVATLTITTMLSLMKARRDARRAAEAD